MRRIALVLAAGAVGVVAALVPASSPADAHGDTIDFAVTADGAGQVTATATWSNDHHPVDERIAATIVATSASGQRVGPFPMTAVVGRPGVLTLAQPLPLGTWTVVAESAVPAIGRGEATLTIGGGPSQSQPASAGSPSAAPPSQDPSPATAAAKDEPASAHRSWIASLGAIAVLAALIGALLVLRRRRS